MSLWNLIHEVDSKNLLKGDFVMLDAFTVTNVIVLLSKVLIIFVFDPVATFTYAQHYQFHYIRPMLFFPFFPHLAKERLANRHFNLAPSSAKAGRESKVKGGH